MPATLGIWIAVPCLRRDLVLGNMNFNNSVLQHRIEIHIILRLKAFRILSLYKHTLDRVLRVSKASPDQQKSSLILPLR